MIRLACERSQGYPNVNYQVVDVLAWDFPRAYFDCIVSIATLHHLPLDEILHKAKEALKPGGVLLVLDLFQSDGLSDVLMNMAAIPVNLGLQLIKTGRLREPKAVRDAWELHGRHDKYLTIHAVRDFCRQSIPGAKIRRHLLWRYSIVWEKPR